MIISEKDKSEHCNLEEIEKELCSVVNSLPKKLSKGEIEKFNQAIESIEEVRLREKEALDCVKEAIDSVFQDVSLILK